MGHLRRVLAIRYTPDRGLFGFSRQSLEGWFSRKPVCSIVNEGRFYLVLRRAGEASATRGDLNI